MSDARSISNVQANVQEEVQELALAPVPEGSKPFLRLYLSEMIVLLPVAQVAEVLTVPMSQIVPLPHLPAWVMGVCNRRGEVLWMVDLGHLCGLSPWYQQANRSINHAVAVLQVQTQQPQAKTFANSLSASGVNPSRHSKSQTLGLVVNHVGEIEWCNPEVFQTVPSSTLLPELASLLNGYWWQSEGDMLAVLDGEAILQAMPQP